MRLSSAVARLGADLYLIFDADVNRVLIDVHLVETSSVHKGRIRLHLLFEQAVGTLPRLDPHAVHLVLEGLPAENSLFEDLLQRLVALQLLLAGVLLVLLHVVVQVDLDVSAVHRSPDVVKALIDVLL